MGKDKHNRFKSGSGAYKCSQCGKLTRDTGYGEADLGICKNCYQLNELENSYQDGDISLEEYKAQLVALAKEALKEFDEQAGKPEVQ